VKSPYDIGTGKYILNTIHCPRHKGDILYLDCIKGNNIQNEDRTSRVIEDYFAFIDCMKD
jgi:hypothetical protein